MYCLYILSLFSSFAFDRAWFLIGVTMGIINNIREKRREKRRNKKYWHFFAEYDLVFNFIKI